MRPSKILLVILDGLGDTTSFIDNKCGTSLEFAEHPVLNACVKRGMTGLMDSVAPGFPCGSDTAHLSLFGYSPFKVYNGRGAFEAIGSGMQLEQGEIAFKSDFSTMEGDIVKYRRCDRHFEEEGRILCRDLDGIKIQEFPEVSVHIHYATEHRCAVSIKAEKLTTNITGTDPLRDNKRLIKSEPLDDSPEAEYTARVVNALSDTLRKALVEHPINKKRRAEGKNEANVILLRGGSARLKIKTFEEIHGIKAFLIAPTAIIAGIGVSVGLQVIKAPGATGDMNSTLDAKADKAIEVMRENQYDMGIIHIKGTDDASHDGNPIEKATLISKADKAIGRLIQGLAQLEMESDHHFILCVAADHTTSVSWKDHSFEPVPVCFADVAEVAKEMGWAHKDHKIVRIEPDSVEEYNEIAAGHGRMGRFCGAKIMDLLLHLANRNC